jgi:hypothetical protein
MDLCLQHTYTVVKIEKKEGNEQKVYLPGNNISRAINSLVSSKIKYTNCCGI